MLRRKTIPGTAPPASFERIYLDNVRLVYNFVLRMTGNAHAAEDITQETFLRAFENIRTFRGDSSVSTWLVAIARNVCINHMQSLARSSCAAIDRVIERESSPYDADHADRAERDEYISQVKNGCLSGLLT